MKRAVKITLWVSGIAVGLIVIIAAVFLIYFMSATREMKPAATEPVNDTVFCIRDRFVNAYIFRTGEDYIMFDAGMREKDVKEEMTKLGIMPDKVNSVFLTHTDGDHIGAMELFGHAAVYMHRDEEQMIDGRNSKGPFKTIWKYGPYTLLEDNDTVMAGNLVVRIIHTPGHTPGSSCYTVNDEYLITGDNITVTDGKADHFTEQFNMDTDQQTESIKVLPDLNNFRYVLTSHHGVIKPGNDH